MNEFLTNLTLIVFIVIIFSYLIGAFFIVYHLLKFGLDYKTKVLTFTFLAGLVILLSLNFYLFLKIDWTEFLNNFFNYTPSNDLPEFFKLSI